MRSGPRPCREWGARAHREGRRAPLRAAARRRPLRGARRRRLGARRGARDRRRARASAPPSRARRSPTSSAATLAHGLLPKVVPELEGITLGGAVAGCSVESMSYRYGGFHDTCREYEVVTGDGEQRVLRPESEAELFHMLHGSYGTLAILTQARVRARSGGAVRRADLPPPPRLRRRSRPTCASAAQQGDFDFVDGIIHAPDELVLCLGRFADLRAARLELPRHRDLLQEHAPARRQTT